MLTDHFNLRLTSGEKQRFSDACNAINASQGEVLRALMALAVTRGLLYDSKTGAIKLKGVPRNVGN